MSTDELELESKRWKHRRRMSYTALVMQVIISIMVLVDTSIVPVSRVTAAEGIIDWMYISFSGIVVAYFGFNVIESKMSAKTSK